MVASGTAPTIERVNVLGVGISVLNLRLTQERLLRAIEDRTPGYVCVTGVHGVMEAQQNPRLKQVLNEALLCTPDGMPMVWMGRLNHFRQMGRVYGPDLMLELLALSPARGIRHFFYGGKDAVAAELRAKMEARFPGLAVVGTYEPPFRPLNPEEERELRALVAQTRPDVFWVGISTPKQELFMADFLPKLEVGIMIGVGAAFDLLAGRVRQAPRWIQRSGLEWCFRLAQEPRRLWRRYLFNNPRFVYAVLRQLASRKKFDLK